MKIKPLKLFLLAFACILANIALADDTIAKRHMLNIYLANGETNSFILSDDKPVVTVNEKKLVINTPTASTEYAYADILYFQFDEITTSALTENIQSNEIRFIYTDGELKIFGLQQYTNIYIYDAGGRQIKRLQANPNFSTISLKGLLKGTYVMKIENRTIKINTK